MPSPILLCTDGSAQSMEALSLGLDLLAYCETSWCSSLWRMAQTRVRLPAPDTPGLICNRWSTTTRSNKPTGVRSL